MQLAASFKVITAVMRSSLEGSSKAVQEMLARLVALNLL